MCTRIITIVCAGKLTQKQCSYCFKWFSPQGWFSHVASHKMRNSTDVNTPKKRMKALRDKKLKLRSPPYKTPFVFESPSNKSFTLSPQSPLPMDLTTDESERSDPTSQSKHFNNLQRLQIIDRHKSSQTTKANTVRWVRTHFKKPKFTRQLLNFILRNEGKYRDASGTKKN